ncbi:unnamed protein product [Bemisia tabaci]|uniref:Transcription initiation factor TFIID subunit 12 n=1 Tax=Bemisia tabaci TaxID=7038 RepID=A0A9P0AFL2_BEMTA|nr:PREDICTED: transcription initiation factor TFIID subunit 12 [Bemisia tabaci]CAH0390540.1 unnamed protein product [Bemisia tabaci]
MNPASNVTSGGIPMDTMNLTPLPTPMETSPSLPQQAVEGISAPPALSNLQVVLNNPNVNNSPSLQVVLNNMNTTSNTTGPHPSIVNTQVPAAVASSSLVTPNAILQTQSPITHVQSPLNQAASQLPSAPSPSPMQTTVSTSAPLQSTVPQGTTTQSTFQQSASSSHLPSMSQAKSSTDHPNQILTKPRLQELVREVDPTEQLDEEVEELMLQLADDFVESAINSACLLAKHRHASTVDVKDVQLHLERNWNMWIPGFGTDELRPYKRAPVTDAHRQRMALIRKTIKKY